MSLTCKVQIILDNISMEKANTVQKALEPDNVNFPEGLVLHIEKMDNKLIFNFESKNNMNKLIGTVDEILEHVKVSLEVID